MHKIYEICTKRTENNAKFVVLFEVYIIVGLISKAKMNLSRSLAQVFVEYSLLWIVY